MFIFIVCRVNGEVVCCDEIEMSSGQKQNRGDLT